MNWEQFLKPDWRKIVLLLILIFFLPIPFVETINCPYICIFNETINTTSCPKCPPSQTLIKTVAYNEFEMLNSQFIISNFITWFLSILSFVIFSLPIIILEYLLSCLIVWIYDKFRKKKGDYVHIQNINMIMGQQKRK